MDDSSTTGFDRTEPSSSKQNGNLRSRTRRKYDRPPTLQAKDWLEAALEILDERGVDAVKILPLSKSLNVSRGSFYWRFESREDLLERLLEYWEEELTLKIMRRVSVANGTPRERLHELMENVLTGRKERYDHSVILWGRIDKNAARAYKRTLRKRLNFIKDLLREANIPEEEVGIRAEIAYSWMMMNGEGLPASTQKEKLKSIGLCLDLVFRID